MSIILHTVLLSSIILKYISIKLTKDVKDEHIGRVARKNSKRFPRDNPE